MASEGFEVFAYKLQKNLLDLFSEFENLFQQSYYKSL